MLPILAGGFVRGKHHIGVVAPRLARLKNLFLEIAPVSFSRE
jgi:hypothetical protein